MQCTFKLPSGKEVKTGSFGGGAGTKHDFELGPDERIIRVEGRAGARIDRIQFFTNQNSKQLSAYSDHMAINYD